MSSSLRSSSPSASSFLTYSPKLTADSRHKTSVIRFRFGICIWHSARMVASLLTDLMTITEDKTFGDVWVDNQRTGSTPSHCKDTVYPAPRIEVILDLLDANTLSASTGPHVGTSHSVNTAPNGLMRGAGAAPRASQAAQHRSVFHNLKPIVETTTGKNPIGPVALQKILQENALHGPRTAKTHKARLQTPLEGGSKEAQSSKVDFITRPLGDKTPFANPHSSPVFEIRITNGNLWDVMEGDIAVPAAPEAQGEEARPEDYDEIEYMAPTAIGEEMTQTDRFYAAGKGNIDVTGLLGASGFTIHRDFFDRRRGHSAFWARDQRCTWCGGHAACACHNYTSTTASETTSRSGSFKALTGDSGRFHPYGWPDRKPALYNSPDTARNRDRARKVHVAECICSIETTHTRTPCHLRILAPAHHYPRRGDTTGYELRTRSPKINCKTYAICSSGEEERGRRDRPALPTTLSRSQECRRQYVILLGLGKKSVRVSNPEMQVLLSRRVECSASGAGEPTTAAEATA
ncbi:hypothetical protein BJV78DRAFT_1321910 [Lactifluus subvellereus]|nr:hypothetical protein BJV78DRAFT_1321910 [Lactifluus subvellereus]